MTIASLMVRLGITGEQEVRAGLASAKTEIRETARAAESAAPAIHRMEQALRATAHAAAVLAGGSILALGAGMAAGSKSAFDLSLQFEGVTARLTALTGSAEVAAQKLKFVQQVAAPSNFTFSQLADASVQLEAFGLRTERVLPSIAKLGMAFAADTEHLQMLTRMFGALAQGQMPDIEQLSAFGLSKGQLAQKGVKFDGNNHLTSSAREAMDALEKVVNEKYGNIFATMGQTTGAKLASLTDAWERFQATIGDGIAKNLTPVIERLTDSISRLVDSGVLADVVSKLATAFGSISSLSSSDGMNQFIARAASFMESVPEMLAFVQTAISQTLSLVGEGITLLFQRLGATLSIGASNALKATSFVFRGLFAGMQAIGDSFAQSAVGSDMNTTMGVAMGVLQSAAPDPFSKADAYLRRMNEANPATGLPQGGGDWGKLADALSAPDSPLSKIEQNTRETADALNLRQQTLGGGALAGLGVTAAEIASQRGANMAARYKPGFARNNVPGQGIDSEIARLIMETLRTMGHTTMRRA
ncbi:MAG: hypothetical protein IPK85_04090 [Gemmatimonadetes bacterium]|nr:hypothetical protein [Gemmatimonadota bacterium]